MRYVNMYQQLCSNVGPTVDTSKLIFNHLKAHKTTFGKQNEFHRRQLQQLKPHAQSNEVNRITSAAKYIYNKITGSDKKSDASTPSSQKKDTPSSSNDDDLASPSSSKIASHSQPTSLEDSGTTIHHNQENLSNLLNSVSSTDLIVTPQGRTFLEQSGINAQKCSEFNGTKQQNELNDKIVTFANYIGDKIATDDSELARKVRRISTDVLQLVNACKECHIIDAGSSLLDLSKDLMRFSLIPEETIAQVAKHAITHPSEYIQQRVEGVAKTLVKVARFEYHVTKFAQMNEFEQFGDFGSERQARAFEEIESYGRELAETINSTISSFANMSLKEREELFAHLFVDSAVDTFAGTAVTNIAKVGKRIIKPRTPKTRAPHHANTPRTVFDYDLATGECRLVSQEELRAARIAEESEHVANIVSHEGPILDLTQELADLQSLEEIHPSTQTEVSINNPETYSLPPKTFSAHKVTIEDGCSKIIPFNCTTNDALQELRINSTNRLI